MDYSFLKIEQHDQITVMKVSAPKSLNALNSTVLKEIDDFVSNLDTKQTRVLIITGDGEKAFVAGADISEMVHLYEKEGYEFSKLGAIAFRKIETLPIPVIAAVNGFCLGGGCELAMACDFRYASSKAKFGQPEVGLGITPEGIVVREIHPEFTFEQMQAATEAKLILDPNWKPMDI